MLPPPAAARIACLIVDQVDRHAQPRALPATFLLAILAAFLAIAFHAAPPAGSLATPAVGASGSGEVRTEEPRMRFNSKFGAMAGAVAVSVGGQAVAQDAVQWRVKDGGNGHWYQVVIVPGGVTWDAAKLQAELRSGRLACLETPQERDFVFTRFSRFAEPSGWTAQTSGGVPVFGPWLGASQMSGSVEPAGGWRWLTGGFFDPTWPFSCCNNACVGSNGEDRLQLYFSDVTGVTAWNDLPNVVTCGNQPISYLVEYDADCNGDGLVDFGQIRAGDLPDANNNNIPDCCEQGVSCSPCAADIVRDGVVNGIDLAAVLTNWGTAGGSLNADVNRDGVVDGSDLATVLASWGPCP